MGDLVNPVTGQRGRPSKSGAIVIDGQEVVSSRNRVRLNELVAGVKKDGDKIHGLLVSAVEKHFEIGEILFDALMNMTANKGAITTQKISDATGVPQKMVSVSIKLYKHFKDNRSYLENLSMKEAVQIISPKSGEGNGKDKPQLSYTVPAGQMQFSDVEESFAFPTLSGCKLDKYRVRVSDNHVYLLQQGYTQAIPIISLSVETPKTTAMESSYADMTSDIQKAIEKYYATVEHESGE